MSLYSWLKLFYGSLKKIFLCYANAGFKKSMGKHYLKYWLLIICIFSTFAVEIYILYKFK